MKRKEARTSKPLCKPFVVQSVRRTRKLVFGASLNDILSKACAEFKIPPKDARLLCDDGSEVDDEYLAHCSDYTVLMVLKSCEKVKYVPEKIKESVEQMQKLLSHRDNMVCAAFAQSDRDRLISLLQESVQELQVPKHLVLADSKEDHPDWFRDLDNETSKKKVMRKKAMCRIKGYYHKSKSDLQKSFAKGHLPSMEHLFHEFSCLLKENDGNGVYFVRGEKDALCTDIGLFSCEGTYDAARCESMHHSINPYMSQEHRVLFGTWNLDHGVERSRSILPAIRIAIEQAKGRQINVEYFYKLLFTRQNLKLVHPVCHLKTKHGNFVAGKEHWYVDSENVAGGDHRTPLLPMRKNCSSKV